MNKRRKNYSFQSSHNHKSSVWLSLNESLDKKIKIFPFPVVIEFLKLLLFLFFALSKFSIFSTLFILSIFVFTFSNLA